MIAWKLREQNRCNTCGTFPEEWYDEDRRLKNDEDVPYEVDSVRCPGCSVMDNEWKQVPSDRHIGLRLFFRRKARRVPR